MGWFGRRVGRAGEQSFEERQKLPAIDDINFRIEPGWYGVDLTVPVEIWLGKVHDVSVAELSLDAAQWSVLDDELRRVYANFAAMSQPLGTFGVRVPPGEAHMTCTSFSRLNGANGPDWPQASPDNYARELVKPDSDARVHVDTVGSWRDEFEVGTCVTAYFLMHYHDGGRQWTEERVSCGYFPHGSRQMIEFAFTTPAVGANGDDFPMLVREMMQSVTVKLDKA